MSLPWNPNSKHYRISACLADVVHAHLIDVTVAPEQEPEAVPTGVVDRAGSRWPNGSGAVERSHQLWRIVSNAATHVQYSSGIAADIAGAGYLRAASPFIGAPVRIVAPASA
jgi:hypothetical protein